MHIFRDTKYTNTWKQSLLLAFDWMNNRLILVRKILEVKIIIHERY
jgi:hypothetical protein